MKSDSIKKGIERAPHRALLYALGCTRQEFDKPFIGIINSYSEIIPGHMHLREIAERSKMASAMPAEFLLRSIPLLFVMALP